MGGPYVCSPGSGAVPRADPAVGVGQQLDGVAVAEPLRRGVHPGDRGYAEADRAAVRDHQDGLAGVRVRDLAEHVAEPVRDLPAGLAAGDPLVEVAGRPSGS